jgi:hypothetical protein
MIGFGIAGTVTHGMSTLRSVVQVRKLDNLAQAVQDEQFLAEVASARWQLYPEVALIVLIFLLTIALTVVGVRARLNPTQPVVPILRVALVGEGFVLFAVLLLDLLQSNNPLVSDPATFTVVLDLPWLVWMLVRCGMYVRSLRMLPTGGLI